MDFKDKYLKYKNKYLILKEQIGGLNYNNINYEIDNNDKNRYSVISKNGNKKNFYSNSIVIKKKDNKYLFRGSVLDINEDKLYKINFKNAKYDILENNGNSLKINFENTEDIFVKDFENNMVLKTFEKHKIFNYMYHFLFNIPEIKIFFENNDNENFNETLDDLTKIYGKELKDAENTYFIHSFYNISKKYYKNDIIEDYQQYHKYIINHIEPKIITRISQQFDIILNIIFDELKIYIGKKKYTKQIHVFQTLQKFINCFYIKISEKYICYSDFKNITDDTELNKNIKTREYSDIPLIINKEQIIIGETPTINNLLLKYFNNKITLSRKPILNESLKEQCNTDVVENVNSISELDIISYPKYLIFSLSDIDKIDFQENLIFGKDIYTIFSFIHITITGEGTIYLKKKQNEWIYSKKKNDNMPCDNATIKNALLNFGFLLFNYKRVDYKRFEKK